MSKSIKRYCFLALLLFAGTAFSQVYPVQGNAALIPPYSLKLSDYASSVSERVIVNVLLNDALRPELKVRLRLRIEGQNVKAETKPEYIGTPILLQGGTLLRLTNLDLAEYFHANTLNFSGITRNEFLKTGSLPEGFYQFCFEVLEYNRGVKISNTICAPAWLILNSPPLVNVPQNETKLKPLNPQSIIFQWTPRHTGSPNSAFNTEYDFKLVELWPSERNSNDAVLTQPAIFETTTTSTVFVYGADATPLEPGKRYAFRVRARSVAGAEELDLFKNNGYSEVFTFQYGDACTTPSLVTADPHSTRILLHWQEEPVHTGYTVKYRMAGSENWYTSTTFTPDISINSLKTTTRYEYQVAATCGVFESAYTNVSMAITDDAPLATYSCGLPPESFHLDPSQLIPALKVGESIKAGDFDVVLTRVTGSDGTYTGEGAVVVPFLNRARAKVAFENIVVNNDRRMVNGTMRVTGGGVEVIPQNVLDALDKLTETLDAADSALNLAGTFVNSNPPDPNSFVADTLITIKSEIVNVFKDPATGTIVVVDSGGNRKTLPAGQNVALVDGKGNGVIVDKNGKKTNTTTSLATAAAKREYNLKVNFAAAPNTVYGFDQKEISALANDYEALPKNYSVSWKAIASHGIDYIQASTEGTVNGTIKFNLSGKPVPTTQVPSPNAQSPSPNAQSLILTGNTDGMTEELIARTTPADTSKKEQILGKLNVVSYDATNYKLKIIPVNGANYPGEINALQTELSKIYAQAVVSWNVELKQNIAVSGIGDPFDDGESGLLSNYTDDMKKVIHTYTSYQRLEPDTYYLFLIPKPKTAGKLGYMPRNKQAGFIFTDPHGGDANALITTVAHELGHGAFHLKHLWTEKPAVSQNTTDNLMDYNKGRKLLKFQWDAIHHPETVIGLFDSDEEAAYSEYLLSKTLNDIKYSFRTNLPLVVKSSPISRPDKINGNVKLDRTNYNNLLITRNWDQTKSVEASFVIGGVSIMANADDAFIHIKDAKGIVMLTVSITVPSSANKETINSLFKYLFPPKPKNLLLFVNGYRNKYDTNDDYEDSSNNIARDNDFMNYWEGIDRMFIEKIGGVNSNSLPIYADGHHQIITSNHVKNNDVASSKLNFAESLLSSENAKLPSIVSQGDNPCYHNPGCVKLHTVPNVTGFNKRVANGRVAGQKIVDQITSGSLIIGRDDGGNVTGTIDIVAHSMGYAYALGMIEKIKSAGYKLGRFYIIAPENACSGLIELNDFEEVWQYGSHEKDDPLWEQDGIAPQCGVQGLPERPTNGSTRGRIYIPKNDPNRGFLGAHSISNYKWIFTLKDENGQIKNR